MYRYITFDKTFMYVLTWPTYYSIGKDQLTILHGQARLKSAQWLSLVCEALSPLQPYSIFKETVRPGSPPGHMIRTDFASRVYCNVTILTTHFSICGSVEMRGFEPLTSAVQRRRSPN